MIAQLRIENFKCFKDRAIPMGGISIIAGANGVGKSTIIQALLLLRETSDQLERRFFGEDTVPLKASIPIRLNDAYHLSLGNTRMLTNAMIESPTVKFTVEAQAQALQIPFVYESDIENAKTTIAYLFESHSAINYRENVSLFAPEFHYLVAERVGPRELYGVADQEFPNTGFAGEYTAHAIEQSDKALVSSDLCIEGVPPLFRSQLEAWLDLIVPGVQITTTAYSEVNRVSIGIARKSSQTGPLSPANIGFGISYVLPIIVSGLLAKPGSMLIVENPEAHLHPAAQSMIGTFLATVASSGVQVVVETHSENVINGVRLAVSAATILDKLVQFIFLSLSPDESEPEVEIINLDRGGDLSVWPKGFFDQQSRDLAALFKAKRSIRDL